MGFNKQKFEKIRLKDNSLISLKLRTQDSEKLYIVSSNKNILGEKELIVKVNGNDKEISIPYDEIEFLKLIDGASWDFLLYSIDSCIENQALYCIFFNGEEKNNLIIDKTDPVLSINQIEYKIDLSSGVIDTYKNSIEKIIHEKNEKVRIADIKNRAADYKIKFKNCPTVYRFDELLLIRTPLLAQV